MVTTGEEGVKLGVWDWQMQTTMYRTYKQGPVVCSTGNYIQ